MVVKERAVLATPPKNEGNDIGKYMSSLATVATCEGADCQGCEDCPDVPMSAIFPAHADIAEWGRMRQQEVWNEWEKLDGIKRWEDLDGNIYVTFPDDAPVQAQPAAHESMPISAVCSSDQNTSLKQTADVGIDYVRTKRPRSMDCASFGRKYSKRLCAGGTLDKKPMPCGECEGCNADWVRLKLERYHKGTARLTFQSFILVEGLADDDAAAEVRAYIGKRLACLRFGIIGYNMDSDLWHSVTVTATAISSRDSYRLTEALKKRHPDAAVTIVDKSVPIYEIQPYLTIIKETPGGHKPTQFSAGWIQPRPIERRYQFGESTVEAVPAGEKSLRAEKHICQHCDSVERRFPTARIADDRELNGPAADCADARAWMIGITLDRRAMSRLHDAMLAGDSLAAQTAYAQAVPHGYRGKRLLITDTAAQLHHTEYGIALTPTATPAAVAVWLCAL